jgi:hypothetical protein
MSSENKIDESQLDQDDVLVLSVSFKWTHDRGTPQESCRLEDWRGVSNLSTSCKANFVRDF